MYHSPFIKIWRKYLDILCCPECVGEDADLTYDDQGTEESLRCTKCNRRYKIIKGVPILLTNKNDIEIDSIKEYNRQNEASPLPKKNNVDSDALMDWKYLSYQYYTRYKEFLNSVKHFTADRTVLDIGCAGGSLAADFKNYIGLDISWKLISFARSYLDKPFVLANAGNMPFKTKSVSHFISRNMLEHSKDDRIIISEAARICDLGGVFELPCSDGISLLIDPINVIRGKMGREPIHILSYGFGHINMQTEQEWEKRLSENGFIITGKNNLGRGIFYKLNTLTEFMLYSFGDNDDIPIKNFKKKYFRYIHPIYDALYKLDPKTNTSWSKVFQVEPERDRKQK